MALNTQIEQMNTQTPAHANEFNKRFNQLGDNDKYLNENIKALQENKVDKINGKGLSDENYSTAEKQKLVNIEAGANKYVHPSNHPASMVTGLHSVATSGDYNDLKNKPDLSNKVDKVSGKGLSTEDFTTELRRKLGGIDYNANNYTHPNTHPASMITCSNGRTVESSMNEISNEIKSIELTADKVSISGVNGITSKSVKGAIQELFTNADNAQRNISEVIGSPLSASDTLGVQKNKIQILKNTLASNLTAKKQNSSVNENLQDLINKVADINIGVKYAHGKVTSQPNKIGVQHHNVSFKSGATSFANFPYVEIPFKFDFTPRFIFVINLDDENSMCTIYASDSSLGKHDGKEVLIFNDSEIFFRKDNGSKLGLQNNSFIIPLYEYRDNYIHECCWIAYGY